MSIGLSACHALDSQSTVIYIRLFTKFNRVFSLFIFCCHCWWKSHFIYIYIFWGWGWRGGVGVEENVYKVSYWMHFLYHVRRYRFVLDEWPWLSLVFVTVLGQSFYRGMCELLGILWWWPFVWLAFGSHFLHRYPPQNLPPHPNTHFLPPPHHRHCWHPPPPTHHPFQLLPLPPWPPSLVYLPLPKSSQRFEPYPVCSIWSGFFCGGAATFRLQCHALSSEPEVCCLQSVGVLAPLILSNSDFFIYLLIYLFIWPTWFLFVCLFVPFHPNNFVLRRRKNLAEKRQFGS